MTAPADQSPAERLADVAGADTYPSRRAAYRAARRAQQRAETAERSAAAARLAELGAETLVFRGYPDPRDQPAVLVPVLKKRRPPTLHPQPPRPTVGRQIRRN